MRRLFVRGFRGFWSIFAALAAVAVLACAAPALGAPAGDGAGAGRAIGFSKLVLRVRDDSGIAIAPEEFRVFVLEYLRLKHLNAVGAENLVFSKDETEATELLLGGTIRELDCRDIPTGESTLTDRVTFTTTCIIGVEWQVLDVATDDVVYRVVTRYVERGVQKSDLKWLGKRLVLGALDSMVGRARFKALIQWTAKKPAAAPRTRVAIARCGAGPLPMPAQASDAMDATVVIAAGKVFGSGFFINEAGYVLTAAHVVTMASLEVRTHDGARFMAHPVRVDRTADIALLKVDGPAPRRCLALDDRTQVVGSDVYVIGSPASQQLAFSITRGIVSGVRDFDGTAFLQTDASVNPGNSGGPIVGSDGRVLAVVSWKVLGRSIEGIAFGVPIGSGLTALGLEPSDHTAAELKPDPAEEFGPRRTSRVVVDVADERPSWDPEADARRAAEREEAEREKQIAEMTPGYVTAMKWGGIALAAGCTFAIIGSSSAYDSGSTHDEYRRLRLVNDIGWIGLGLGAASFTASLFLTPSLPKEAKSGAGTAVSVGVAGNQVRIGVVY